MYLLDDHIDFDNDTLLSLVGRPHFSEHLYRTYKLRNIESHQCEEWTKRELGENIESVLVIYLFATWKSAAQLSPILNTISNEKEHDFKPYLESVKESFKSRISRFVHIKSQEDLKLSDGYVIENRGDSNEENDRIERKGTVDSLRKGKIHEKRMLIWGDAGMGKSTTLEYLAYQDAENRLRSQQAKIPVYIPLGLLTDKNISIEQAIFNKLGIDNHSGKKLLKEGKINLFLDAINEIPKDDNYQLKS